MAVCCLISATYGLKRGEVMKPFHFACPTEIYYGINCLNEHTEVFERLGHRAYIISAGFPENIKNIALCELEDILRAKNIEYVTDKDVMSDPPVEKITEIFGRVRQFNPDFLIAVGGGSSMDTAKCVNILLKYPENDAYMTLFGPGAHVFGVGRPNEGKLPLISITTTAGTGADLTGVAVITRNDIHSKSGTNRRCFADYAFIDPRYVQGAPSILNHATAIDALCHGIEGYLSRDSEDDFMTNMLSERAFSLFAEIKKPLIENNMTMEDTEKQALHAMLQGMVIINEVTGVPHGLGYPLSYYYHVPHGIACGIFEGEYVRIFGESTRVRRLLNLLEFADADEFCDYIQALLTPHIHIEVREEQIIQWTNDFCNTAWRIARHPKPLTREMVSDIYHRALRSYIVNSHAGGIS